MGNWQYWRWLISTLFLVNALEANVVWDRRVIVPGQLYRQPWQLATIGRQKSDATEQVNAQFSPAVPLTYENLKPEETHGSNVQPPNAEFYQLSPPAAPASVISNQPWSVQASPPAPEPTIQVWSVEEQPDVPEPILQPWGVQQSPAAPGHAPQPWNIQQSPAAPVPVQPWNVQQIPVAPGIDQSWNVQKSPAAPESVHNVHPDAQSASGVHHSQQKAHIPADAQVNPSVSLHHGSTPVPAVHAPAAPEHDVHESVAHVSEKPKYDVSVHYEAASPDGHSFGYSYSYPTIHGRSMGNVHAKAAHPMPQAWKPTATRHRESEGVAATGATQEIDPRCVNDHGLTWKEDCNTCWCIAGGHVACTRKRCIHEDTTPAVVN